MASFGTPSAAMNFGLDSLCRRHGPRQLPSAAVGGPGLRLPIRGSSLPMIMMVPRARAQAETSASDGRSWDWAACHADDRRRSLHEARSASVLASFPKGSGMVDAPSSEAPQFRPLTSGSTVAHREIGEPRLHRPRGFALVVPEPVGQGLWRRRCRFTVGDSGVSK